MNKKLIKTAYDYEILQTIYEIGKKQQCTY